MWVAPKSKEGQMVDGVTNKEKNRLNMVKTKDDQKNCHPADQFIAGWHNSYVTKITFLVYNMRFSGLI